MLGGARDEVVPRSQMQDLWAIIRNRGRETAKKPPAGSVKAKGAAEEEDEDEDGKKEDVRSGSSRSRPKLMPATGSGSDDRKVPPKVVVDGENTFIEFPDGMHSELYLLKSLVTVSCSLLCVDDTCVQPGYWSAVAEFVAGLRPKVALSSPSS